MLSGTDPGNTPGGTGHGRDSGDEDFRAELSATERELGRTFDPGTRGVIIPAVMLLLACCLLLPWVGSASGWEILVGRSDEGLDVGLLPRLFALNAAIAGLVLSALALVTRRWAMAFLAAFGCTIVAFEGMIAIWSRQTVPEAGPSFGLLIAVVAMLVLMVQWLKIAWSRS